MARKIRVRVVLNKGRRGVPLAKIPKVIGELGEFLRDLAADLAVPDPDVWQGIEFRNGSLDFIAEHGAVVSDDMYERFNISAANIIQNRPDGCVSKRTRKQYVQIASPIDPDEVVYIGVQIPSAGGDAVNADADFSLYELTHDKAAAIELSIQARVREVGSVQGYVHSVFLEAEQPHFQLRELSSKRLVKCVYREQKYPLVASALKQRRAVIHVFGPLVIDTLSRSIEQIEVNDIWVSPPVEKEFLDHFFGCASGALIDLEARSRGETN